jgi:Tetratricopeptide repeat
MPGEPAALSMVRRHDARTLPAGRQGAGAGRGPPPDLGSRNNLADAYESAGDLGRAIPLYEQTLADRLRVLGAHHPHTKIVRGNLAAARQHPQ